MSLSFKKTYKFAIKSALYITLFAAGFVSILGYLFFKPSQNNLIAFALAFAISIYIFSFFVIQYRVEVFIYRRVKKIYDDVSFLEASSFRKQPITTDMATLTKEVKKFANDKKME